MTDAMLGLLPSIGKFLEERIKKRLLLDEPGKHAVEKLLRAVNETKLYLGAMARQSRRDIDREVDLSRCWNEAAAALHGLDDSLAQRCRMKGEYWTDPTLWDSKKLKNARILLSQVSKDADILLGWKKGAR